MLPCLLSSNYILVTAMKWIYVFWCGDCMHDHCQDSIAVQICTCIDSCAYHFAEKLPTFVMEESV